MAVQYCVEPTILLVTLYTFWWCGKVEGFPKLTIPFPLSHFWNLNIERKWKVSCLNMNHMIRKITKKAMTTAFTSEIRLSTIHSRAVSLQLKGANLYSHFISSVLSPPQFKQSVMNQESQSFALRKNEDLQEKVSWGNYFTLMALLCNFHVGCNCNYLNLESLGKFCI